MAIHMVGADHQNTYPIHNLAIGAFCFRIPSMVVMLSNFAPTLKE